MPDVTPLLRAAADLLPLVYDELRKLAAARMASERPDHTLDATALVHEAYLRLVGGANRTHWDHRRQFLTAAAEAMRRILVDHARARRGGTRVQVELADLPQPGGGDATDWVVVDDALARLAAEDPQAADLVRLRLFAGASVEEAAELLGVSRATAYRDWAYARAWLRDAAGIGGKAEKP